MLQKARPRPDFKYTDFLGSASAHKKKRNDDLNFSKARGKKRKTQECVLGTCCLKKKRERKKKMNDKEDFLTSRGYFKVLLRNSAVCRAATTVSETPWGPRSMGCTAIFQAYQKVPPARKVPSDPSILIPLGINRTQPSCCHGKHGLQP